MVAGRRSVGLCITSDCGIAVATLSVLDVRMNIQFFTQFLLVHSALLSWMWIGKILILLSSKRCQLKFQIRHLERNG